MAVETLARYLHTVRYLKPVQLLNRISRTVLPLRAPVPAPSELTFRSLTPGFDRPGRRPAFRQGGAEFFGRYHDIDFVQSWDVDDDDLWQYNLHYFDDLWMAGGKASGVDHDRLINAWIDTQTDINGVGLAPYPTSLRIVNWCKYFWSLPGEELTGRMLRSLAIQAATLERRIEYHLLANHLFANAKALAFAGAAFEGRFGTSLLQRGLRILDEQIDEQFLADGAHIELSPMYHNILAWDVLDLLALSRSAGLAALESRAGRFEDAARKSIAWSRHMTHPDGEVAFFNDAAIGVAPTTSELERYAGRLGVAAAGDPPASERSVWVEDLRDSGYAVVRTADYKAILDLAEVGPPYQPGHAHADTLSFEMSVFGRRCVVNTGVSTYRIGDERDFERSTRAHNTVEVNGRNSSDVWAGFRVARRAVPFDRKIRCDSDCCTVECAHSGYMAAPGNAVHARKWRFSRHAVSITDRVTGNVRTAYAFLHFHPACEIWECKGGWRVAIDEHELLVESDSSSAAVESYEWHESFGRSETAKRIVLPFDNELTVSLKFGGGH